MASRTPLFNLASAFVMGIAGHGFDIYQLASALTNICFVLSLFLLLRDLFGRRAAWLALLLAPLNLWMLHNAWFTWPKMLATYYLVFALHFYLQSMRHCRGIDPRRAASYFVGFRRPGPSGYSDASSGRPLRRCRCCSTPSSWPCTKRAYRCSCMIASLRSWSCRAGRALVRLAGRHPRYGQDHR